MVSIKQSLDLMAAAIVLWRLEMKQNGHGIITIHYPQVTNITKVEVLLIRETVMCI